MKQTDATKSLQQWNTRGAADERAQADQRDQQSNRTSKKVERAAEPRIDLHFHALISSNTSG